MELVPLPLPSLDLLLVLAVVNVVTPEVTQETRLGRGRKKNTMMMEFNKQGQVKEDYWQSFSVSLELSVQ